MRVTAKAVRSGDWWAVEVPEVDGAYTQAKRLDQIPAMVADAVYLLADVPVVDVEVDLDVDFGDPALLAEAREVRQQVGDAVAAQDRAATASRRVVTRLRGRGLSVRDVGALLHLSPQRVSQLARSKESA